MLDLVSVFERASEACLFSSVGNPFCSFSVVEHTETSS